ncbi:AAA family ATPase [Yersinia frederiksenii]|uniref:AAA family ATPase n=1 Tax=Yersinia frederiksenii TaxID=29484 RepID=UPI0005DA91CE|nr:AAA family ATPase [Yersinia frederiksenii]CNF17134.1 adenylylsulfate kinase [Yersinia frederiksenii]
MLIIFSGLPGTGKSTIAHLLAERLKAVYLRIDTIEQAIRSADSEGENMAMGPTGYIIAYEVARENLLIGSTVITDSVNPMALTRNAYRDVALSVNVPFLDVEIICSNLDEHRLRVENRTPDIKGFTLPDWQKVINRHYEPWDRIHLQLDTAKLSALQCVDKIIALSPVNSGH